MARQLTALVVNPFVTDFKLYDEWMHPVGLYFLIDLLTLNGVKVYFFNCLERRSDTAPKKYGTGRFRSTVIPRPDCYRDIRRKYKCYGCSPHRFVEYLRNLPPIDIVFVGSMMTYWVDGLKKTIELIWQVLPEVAIVCGGVAVRLTPEYFHRNLPDVKLFTGTVFDAVGSSLIIDGLRQSMKVPATLSMINGLQKAIPIFHAPILLSLGCPMHCAYCASNILQPNYLRRSIDTVWEEILFCVDRYNIKDFAVYDDAVLYEADKLFIPLLERIISRGISVRIHLPNGVHIKYVNRFILKTMKKAGVVTLRFGYESGYKEHLRYTGGKVYRNMLKETMMHVKECDFPDVGVYVMAGLPGSVPEQTIEEMKSVASLGAAVKPVFISPVPGTEIFMKYAGTFPELLSDPRTHNDTYFTTKLPAWGEKGMQMVRDCAKKLNRK